MCMLKKAACSTDILYNTAGRSHHKNASHALVHCDAAEAFRLSYLNSCDLESSSKGCITCETVVGICHDITLPNPWPTAAPGMSPLWPSDLLNEQSSHLAGVSRGVNECEVNISVTVLIELIVSSHTCMKQTRTGFVDELRPQTEWMTVAVRSPHFAESITPLTIHTLWCCFTALQSWLDWMYTPSKEAFPRGL